MFSPQLNDFVAGIDENNNLFLIFLYTHTIESPLQNSNKLLYAHTILSCINTVEKETFFNEYYQIINQFDSYTNIW